MKKSLKMFGAAVRLCLKRETLACVLLSTFSTLPNAVAQEPVKLRAVVVDERGIMRWADDRSEVALFGVNYTAPFAYAYRAFGYVGADRKAAIDMDVSHIARLGLTAYRIHVWDRLITDAEGNLLENDHVDLLDYLIAQLEARGIHVILTPIFGGGAGYPERDPPTTGFSTNYSKGALTTDTTARRLQRNYFTQFVKHVNRYTGRSYSSDPGLIAIELFNEPDHPSPPAEQTRYINDIVDAVRAAGFTKPILYNVSQGWSQPHARAVCSANIQGVTFQWYPTGLVRGSAIRANMLPNVDTYPIPPTPECANKARLVYEFDAADVLASYMYPAIARSFRTAGMQWATQFAYDPGAIAFANTEYPTHYLNLLYTPKKAISLLIASEAFRRLPRGKSYGVYPQDRRFDDFRVSYEDDLSELNTAVAFYNSNDTHSKPVKAGALRHVAGTGNSSIVQYNGSGAYFLDRLDTGVWRLEVYPDVVLLSDVFGRNRIDRAVARLETKSRRMSVSLPDLGNDFTIEAVNTGNTLTATAETGVFEVHPGVYVLRRAPDLGANWRDPNALVGNRKLGEYYVPAAAKGTEGDSATATQRHREDRGKVVLFELPRDTLNILYPHPWEYVKFRTAWVRHSSAARWIAVRASVESLEPMPQQFTLRAFVGEDVRAQIAAAHGLKHLRIRARSGSTTTDSLGIAVVQRNGTAWGTVIQLTPEWRDMTIPLSRLTRVPLALLPRPYPHFLPEELIVESGARGVNVGEIEGVQFSLRGDMYDANARKREHTFEIERVELER